MPLMKDNREAIARDKRSEGEGVRERARERARENSPSVTPPTSPHPYTGERLNEGSMLARR